MIDINNLINVQDLDGKTCGLAFITPEQAKMIIENNANPRNRKINERSVMKYKKDMESGDFAETTLLCFDKANMLTDGHNRMNALARADVKGQWFVVLIGSENDRCIFDRGGIRTTAQTMYMMGDDRVTGRDVAIARILVAVDKYGTKGSFDRCNEVSDAETQDYIMNNCEWFEKLKSAVSMSGLHTRKTPIAAGLLQAIKAGVDLNVIVTFCKVLNEGYANGQNESAAITLRKQIESDFHRSGYKRFMFESATEEAMFAFATGTPRKKSFDGRKTPYSDMIAIGLKEII